MKRFAPLFAAALSVAAGWTGSRAQVPEPSPDALTWQLGPVQLIPVARLGSQRNDNLFSRPAAAGATPATVRTVDAGFLASLPFARSRTTLGYLYGWRDFGQPGLTGESNHQAQLSAELVFSNGITLAIRDDYVDGVLDTETVDPGREVPFVAQRFRRNAPGIALHLERPGIRRVGIAVGGFETRFAEPRAAGFFDQDARGIRIDGWHALTPTSAAIWSFDASRSDFDRPAGIGFGADARSERRNAARAGARVRPGPALAVELQAGWARYDYEGDRDSRFNDWVANVVVDRRDPVGARLTFTAARDAYPAIFGDANFLVSRQARLTASNSNRARIGAGGGVSYYVNAYPGTTSPRRDRSRVVEAWAGWRPRPALEWRLEARRERRSSTLAGVGFDRNEWGVFVRFGG